MMHNCFHQKKNARERETRVTSRSERRRTKNQRYLETMIKTGWKNRESEEIVKMNKKRKWWKQSENNESRK